MITAELFERLFPTKGFKAKPQHNLIPKRQELIDALNKYLPLYEINTHKRVAAFLGCCGIETDYFRTTEEYASGADYEGRADLGNTQAGDGKRFKGRGIIQTTGRNNYRALTKTIGQVLGINFEKDPGVLNIVPLAVESACVYWKMHNLNQYADVKQIKWLNAKVNRGSTHNKKGVELTPLHWTDRNVLTSKCLRYIPENFTFATAVTLVDNEFTPQPDGPKAIDITPEMEGKFTQAADLAKGPNVKTFAGKIAGKIGTPLALAWSTTTGKILLTTTAVILAAGICYTAYLYRKQIQIGWETVKSFAKKKAGLS